MSCVYKILLLGAIIDSKLSEMDTEQLELTQLNEKILQCLQLYDSLMQEQLSTMNTSYMPQMTNSMASMSLQVNTLMVI
jgi:hypothetical protein